MIPRYIVVVVCYEVTCYTGQDHPGHLHGGQSEEWEECESDRDRRIYNEVQD